MKDIHGQAIWDYYRGDRQSKLTLHNSYGTPEKMPVEVFFREPGDFSEIEDTAITHCRGKILDLGAAAGSHALLMQALEIDVTALDNSKGCVDTMIKSDLKNVVLEDYKTHQGKYDTILLLMNGLGLAGKLEALPAFLSRCFKMLNAGGQIIFDSSDISYLYQGGLKKPNHYYGEISYQYEYKGQKGDWFDWLYIDPKTLIGITESLNLQCDILLEDGNDQYLARVEKS